MSSSPTAITKGVIFETISALANARFPMPKMMKKTNIVSAMMMYQVIDDEGTHLY